MVRPPTGTVRRTLEITYQRLKPATSSERRNSGPGRYGVFRVVGEGGVLAGMLVTVGRARSRGPWRPGSRVAGWLGVAPQSAVVARQTDDLPEREGTVGSGAHQDGAAREGKRMVDTRAHVCEETAGMPQRRLPRDIGWM